MTVKLHLLVLCLLLVVVHHVVHVVGLPSLAAAGYIPSTHKSQRRVLKKTSSCSSISSKVQKKDPIIIDSSSSSSERRIIRLNPVLDSNPLDAATRQQYQQQNLVASSLLSLATTPSSTTTRFLNNDQIEYDETTNASIKVASPTLISPSTTLTTTSSSTANAVTDVGLRTTTTTSAATAAEEDDEERRQVLERRQAFFVSSSAALAGFTDVLCLARYGCFVNMCTGNLIKMTNAIANFQTQEALVHGLFVVSYMMGVAVFCQLKDLAKAKAATSSTTTADSIQNNNNKDLVYIAPVVAMLFSTADLVARPLLMRTTTMSSTSIAMMIKALQVPFLAAGFGIINSAANHATGGTIFFAVTGHLTKITTFVYDNLKQQQQQQRRVIWKVDAPTEKSITVVRNFLGGALVAALLLQLQQRAAVAAGSLASGLAMSHTTRAASILLHVPPLCTSLGLLYGALFFWYAPMITTTTLPVDFFQKLHLAAAAAVRNSNNQTTRLWVGGKVSQMTKRWQKRVCSNNALFLFDNSRHEGKQQPSFWTPPSLVAVNGNQTAAFV